MFVEASGDATFTALIEGRDATEAWAKEGIMFCGSLDDYSSYYSLLLTGDSGLSNQIRNCNSCTNLYYGDSSTNPDSVWLRVIKKGNVFSSFYRLPSESV